MSYENKEYILQFFEGVHEEENRDESTQELITQVQLKNWNT